MYFLTFISVSIDPKNDSSTKIKLKSFINSNPPNHAYLINIPLIADGDWCLPSQLLTCADLTTQHHIPCQLLHQQTGLKYIHPYISASLEASLLLQLGVQRLNAKHVCEVGKAVVKMMTDDVKKFKAIQGLWEDLC